jgi:superfamily I DNA/RNA helicase
MTLDFFEGAAGTGKTHNLVSRACELVQQGILGDDRFALALTFMNGARRRLQLRLVESPHFRRRFECQTFDVFARSLALRRRSLLSNNSRVLERAATLGEFEGPCFLASTLLEIPAVQRWVAATFPLVLVDEAQDLDPYRMHILRGLSASCSIVVAADAFQCLAQGMDVAAVMGWLEQAGQTHRLTQPMRTSQSGLLSAAHSVRNGQDIRASLTKSPTAKNPTWTAAGFRLLQTHASSSGLLAWTIANEISQRSGQTVILTPDSGHALLRAALEAIQTRAWTRASGQTFGPYSCAWEARDDHTAASLLSDIQLPAIATYADFCTILASKVSKAPVARALARMDRLRRVRGQSKFTSETVIALVDEAARDQARFGYASERSNLVMTIHRAKNREFKNVIVLWPYSATGSSTQLRRLLYNGITRAITHCTVIVLGKGRLDAPPFSA